jgi:large subunit ribosomal protein L32
VRRTIDDAHERRDPGHDARSREEHWTDMGVPKRKVAHARQMDRRSHHALTLPRLEACPHCHEPKLSHRVCQNCGWYNGRQAIELKPAGGSGAEESNT